MPGEFLLYHSIRMTLRMVARDTSLNGAFVTKGTSSVRNKQKGGDVGNWHGGVQARGLTRSGMERPL